MNPSVRSSLGFYQRIPDHLNYLGGKKNTYGKAELLVVDSPLIEDYSDPEAKVGFYSKGFFKGFKEEGV